MADEGWALALPFDTDNSEFVRGVEVGRVWEILKNTPEEFEQTVHVSNAEMMIRMAEAKERTVRSTLHMDDIWMTVRFGEADAS